MLSQAHFPDKRLVLPESGSPIIGEWRSGKTDEFNLEVEIVVIVAQLISITPQAKVVTLAHLNNPTFQSESRDTY
jgi:hypothetical protein